MIRKLFIIIFLFLSANCFADVVITDYNQDVELTDFGRKVNIDIKAKVKLENNYYINSWDYIFGKGQKIQVSDAKVIGKKYKSYFANNKLKFEFEKSFNGDDIEVNFTYMEFSDNNIQKYTRADYVLMPEFAKNANGVLNLTIPDNYVVFSLNPNFKQNINKYSWTGKIPNEGFSDIFYLTLKKAKWRAEILTEVTGKNNLSKIDVRIPAYFKNLNNKIDVYNITTNFDDYFAKIKEDEKNITVNFDNINSSIVQVKIDTILESDVTGTFWTELDPNKYLKVDSKLTSELSNVINRVVQQNNEKKEPIYLALAKFVHDYIVYDKSYYGKQMTTEEILKTGSGVCAHYSQLYNDLLRSVGIPSIIVFGMSYDTENQKFESHSWNLVYINGKWLEIDPTLGLYYGKMPISHIAFYLDSSEAIKYTVYDANISDFKSDIKRNIQFLE